MHPNTHEPIDCPGCSRPLIQLKVGTTIVDACDGGCGGIWFDHFELQKMDNATEEGGDLLGEVKHQAGTGREPGRKLTCPRCRKVVLRQHFFSIRQQVEVDSCPGCGGYWLDHGEIDRVRSEFADAAARQKATHQFMEELDDRHQEPACPDAMQKAARVTSLSAMFRIVGSRYVKRR